jgi:DNA-binding response OmpR family regulator
MDRPLQQSELGALNGAHLLVVEDEYLLLLDLEMLLREAGAEDVAALRSVAEGLAAVGSGRIDAAILDVRIGGESVAPVARALAALGVPFVFYTGQVSDDSALREWPQQPVLAKPALPESIVTAVAGLLRP